VSGNSREPSEIAKRRLSQKKKLQQFQQDQYLLKMAGRPTTSLFIVNVCSPAQL
jgi:hypothetical protein